MKEYNRKWFSNPTPQNLIYDVLLKTLWGEISYSQSNLFGVFRDALSACLDFFFFLDFVYVIEAALWIYNRNKFIKNSREGEVKKR